MADKKKKKADDDIAGAIKQAGDRIRKVTDPFSKVMGAMDKAGRWLFGEPKNSQFDKRKKRLQQAGERGK